MTRGAGALASLSQPNSTAGRASDATMHTNNPSTNIASTSSAAAYDDLQRRLYFAHLTPTATASPDEYPGAHDGGWHFPPRPYAIARGPAIAVPWLKSEYQVPSFDMASIPVTPSSNTTKHECPDGVTSDRMHDDNSSHTPSDGKIEVDQDEVDAIIRNKRKVRDPKACYACHRRKVKCDRNLPCDSCVKRDHPELCSYERPTKKKRIALNSNMATYVADGSQAHADADESYSTSGSNILVPKEHWEKINGELQKLRATLGRGQQQIPLLVSASDAGQEIEREDPQHLGPGDVSEREGIHAPSTQMGTMHLGSRSVLAYMVGDRSKSSQDAARLLLEENILPNLGLDNETATYPFVDLWSTESSISDVSGLCRALPEDGLVLDFWKSYRDVACIIYPVVPDKVQFEQTLNKMLLQRSDHNRRGLPIDPNKPYGVSMPWLALVFAMLASGAQCGTLPAKERELTSQVYVCCAYQALRMANFLSHPCLDTIEACLIIGNALSYNMNPGVSYIFLGMTLRSALSMGLHVDSQNFSEHENYLRARIWWALAWQDSHFSVSYDRPSSSILCFLEIPYARGSLSGHRSYVESMLAIIKLTQEIIRDRTINPNRAMSLQTIQRYKETMFHVINDAAPRLKDGAHCTTVIEHMERCAFKLHSSYMLSEICRPTLKETSKPQPTSQPMSHVPPTSGRSRRKSSLSAHSNHSAQSPGATPADSVLQIQLRAECISGLKRVVEAYVELHTHSVFACRSWVGIQRSISAAFLLGLVPETRQDPGVLSLLRDLERCIAQRAAEDIGFAGSGSPVTQSHKLPTAVSNGIRTGLDNSPSWARSMTKSLHALGKLNATLAVSDAASIPGNSAPNRAQTKPMTQPTPRSTGNAYVGPGGSLGNGVAVGSKGSPSSMGGKHSELTSQYPRAGYPAHLQNHNQPGQLHNRPADSPIMRIESPSVNSNASNGYMSGQTSALAPITPESVSSGGEWHYGNLAERALEYVQPGLWG